MNSRWENLVQVYPQAVKFVRFSTYNPAEHKDRISKRSKISYFSRHSRLRLRESISKFNLPNVQNHYGLTLTLPWLSDKSKISFFNDEYKKVFNRFQISLRRKFPNSAGIYRHELQQRKIPHCHLIFYLSSIDGYDEKEFFNQVKILWFQSLQGNLFGGSLTYFTQHGVRIDRLDSKIELFRYISDHTSKSKQAQLGYQGKQWGIFNRQAFDVIQPIVYKFKTDFHRIYFSRHISKLSRFSISIKGSKKQNLKKSLFMKFDRKKIRNHSKCGLRFINSNTTKKILSYLDSHDVRSLQLRDF